VPAATAAGIGDRYVVTIKYDMAIIQKSTPTTERVLGWIGLLTLAQLADLLTTRLDMSFGAVEGNQIAAHLLQQGGLWYLWSVKLLLVVALISVALLIRRYRMQNPGPRSDLAQLLLWRGVQLCVMVLAATAVYNFALLGQITGWLPG
jgi:hypothetical protein